LAFGVPDRFIDPDAMILQEGKRVLESSHPTSKPRARKPSEPRVKYLLRRYSLRGRTCPDVF
jgi:hypothetical protein